MLDDRPMEWVFDSRMMIPLVVSVSLVCIGIGLVFCSHTQTSRIFGAILTIGALVATGIIWSQVHHYRDLGP